MDNLFYVVHNPVTDQYLSGDFQNDGPLKKTRNINEAVVFRTIKEANFPIFYFRLNKKVLDWNPLLVYQREGRFYVK